MTDQVDVGAHHQLDPVLAAPPAAPLAVQRLLPALLCGPTGVCGRAVLPRLRTHHVAGLHSAALLDQLQGSKRILISSCVINDTRSQRLYGIRDTAHLPVCVYVCYVCMCVMRLIGLVG